MGHVAQFQQAQVGQHPEGLLDEGEQPGHEDAGGQAPETGQGRVLQQQHVQRLAVDDIGDDVQHGGDGAGGQAHVDQLAAAADASQAEDCHGIGPQQEDEFRQAMSDGHGHDPAQHAGHQQGHFLAIDDGHSYAEEHERHQFGPPGVVGGHGQGHGGHAHRQDDAQTRQAGQRSSLAVTHVDAAQDQKREDHQQHGHPAGHPQRGGWWLTKDVCSSFKSSICLAVNGCRAGASTCPGWKLTITGSTAANAAFWASCVAASSCTSVAFNRGRTQANTRSAASVVFRCDSERNADRRPVADLHVGHLDDFERAGVAPPGGRGSPPGSPGSAGRLCRVVAAAWPGPKAPVARTAQRRPPSARSNRSRFSLPEKAARNA